MIKVFDTTNEIYLPFEDYTEAMTNTGTLGRKRTITAITEYSTASTTTSATTTAAPATTAEPGNIQVTSAGHGFITGQSVTIAETTNYDGTYEVTVVDEDNFICLECPWEGDETSGEAYPYLANSYYFAFLFLIEDLFTRVKKLSALRASAIRDKSGNKLVDEFSFTEDRRDTFLILARDACDRAFNRISGYTSIIQNAYFFNEQIDYDNDGSISTSEDDYMVHMMVSLTTDDLNVNILPQVEQKLFDAIVNGILKDWFAIMGSVEDSLKHERIQEDSLLGAAQLLGRSQMTPGIDYSKNFF